MSWNRSRPLRGASALDGEGSPLRSRTTTWEGVAPSALGRLDGCISSSSHSTELGLLGKCAVVVGGASVNR